MLSRARLKRDSHHTERIEGICAQGGHLSYLGITFLPCHWRYRRAATEGHCRPRAPRSPSRPGADSVMTPRQQPQHRTATNHQPGCQHGSWAFPTATGQP